MLKIFGFRGITRYGTHLPLEIMLVRALSTLATEADARFVDDNSWLNARQSSMAEPHLINVNLLPHLPPCLERGQKVYLLKLPTMPGLSNI